MIRSSHNKVFCIGLNKTGTTTVEQVYRDLNLRVGKQTVAEYLLKDWGKRRFNKLYWFCRTANAFQDTPFSLPFTYVALYSKFPNAKFILTVRNSPEDWYNSITKFHSNLWGDNNGIPPTPEQLKNAEYKYKGRAWEANRLMFTSPPDDPYHKETLIKHYLNHIQNVEYFFKDIPDSLIKINVAVQDDYFRLCKFLNKKPVTDGFPWLNKTQA